MAATEEQKSAVEKSLEQHIANLIDEQIFHPPNLTEDDELRKNIDHDGFMPLGFITSNRLITSLTTDLRRIKRGIELCKSVQLSEDGNKIKVDLQPKRATLILRNQPDNATQKDIEQIFLGDPNCATFREMRPDISNTWFVTFDSEEECMKTVLYLQRERNMSVGVKNAVNPLTERLETSPKSPPQAMPVPAATATKSSASVVADIMASKTIASVSAAQHDFYEEHYRNPYARMSNYGGPPVAPVLQSDPVMQSPPLLGMRSIPDPMYDQQPMMDLPPEVPNGDYTERFEMYDRNAMVQIYQSMLKANAITRPETMIDDPDCVQPERLESTMVQKAKNPSTRKPRAEKARQSNNRRRSPRGRNQRGRDPRDRDARDPNAPMIGSQMPPGPPPFYDDYYGYSRAPPPPEPYQQQGFYDTFDSAHPGGGYNRQVYDDGYEDERRPRRRSPRGRSPRGRRNGGPGRGRGRGGKQPRRPKQRREYRPVGSAEEPRRNEDYDERNGSTNRPRNKAPKQKQRARRGRPKLVYRPKEATA